VIFISSENGVQSLSSARFSILQKLLLKLQIKTNTQFISKVFWELLN